MHHFAPRRGLIAALLFALAATAAHAGNRDDAIAGRVRHADDSAITVCFDDGAHPAIGDRLVVIRHDLVAPNAKTLPVIKSSEVGAAEIVRVDEDRCASARLVSGKAAAMDWIALDR